MDFRRLRLAGFKSFVEPCELRIEPGLTGVVGPNGCGKSNLLEAIRWVMGEGSPKSLRSGAMDDVIFAGTATRPSRDFADVTLALDNHERTAPSAWNDGDQIEVVRRIERGTGSAYRINGREARARDVQMLFADSASGAHSPALVSQGRIGAIVAANPVERRALLEEAAGIAGLHVRRKEAEIRLRAAEANLLRLDDAMKAMEAQAAALRRQARMAVRYTELSDRIRVAEAALLHARWQAASGAADAARAEATAAAAHVDHLTREAARLATASAEAGAALPALRDAEARAAAGLQHLVQQRSGLAAELARVEARRRELAAQAAAGARDRDREVALAADARTALDRLADERARLAVALAAARDGLPALAAAVRDIEGRAAAGEAALSAAIEAHARATAQARAAEAALQAAEARLGRTRAEQARLTVERDGLAKLPDGTAQRDAGHTALDRAGADIVAATQALAAAEQGRGAAVAARDTAQGQAAVARGGLAALTAERGALVRVLTAARSGGETLLDRLTVTPGYEAALVAALGDDLSAGVGSGARHWGPAGHGDSDAALPDAVQALAAVVAAPPELTRRLAQVGIVAPVDAERLAALLAPGQRLVTQDGRLWRWDGFRSAGGEGRAAAERLVQRARLAAVDTELPALHAAVAEAVGAMQAAERELAALAQAETTARTARAAAERAQGLARADLARLAADAERRTARLDAADAALARLATEADAYAAEAEAARATAAEITGLDALAVAVAQSRRDAEIVRAGLATARAAHATEARRIDSDTARLLGLTGDAQAWEARAAATGAQLADLAARAATVAADTATLAARPAEIAAATAALATAIADAEADRRAAADTLAAHETGLRATDAAGRTAVDALADAREARARAQAHAEHHDAARADFVRIAGERFQTAAHALPDRLGFDPGGAPDALAQIFDALTAERERLGPVNLRAATKLAEIEASVAASTAERTDLDTAIVRLRGSIGALNREGRVRLLAAFQIVDAHFRTLFATLFASAALGGGAAHLELTESDDPLLAGLEIMAQPPGKKLQSLTLLSGGEQALTAIALIFALFLTTPSPLCVLDEVDAPLDDANVERFCDLLDHMAATTRTRFLIVTHNAVTMSRMHRLYGVTMAEPGVSQLVSVDLARAELLLAAE